ncbi:MAG: acylphosphatase [Actinobacteria bacterium]|nr:acylphosphatase [Actinomycetota bacterium]
MKRVRVIISGRVQGVFFRAYTRQEAESRGLRGWVRNLPDGRVEAVFEGDERAVDDMVAWCRVGPPAAAVTATDLVEEEPAGEPGFFIR